MFIRPWSKDAERILKQLSLNNGRAYTPNRLISREFGKKYPSLFDEGYLDVAYTRYSKRNDKTIFVTPPDVMVIPKPSQKGIGYHFRRFKIL